MSEFSGAVDVTQMTSTQHTAVCHAVVSCHMCRHARHVFADVFAGVVSLCVAVLVGGTSKRVNVRWIRTESYGISSGCDDIHYDSHGNDRLDTEIGRAVGSSAAPMAKIPDDASASCVSLWNVHSARQRGVDTQDNVREKQSRDVQVVDVVSVALRCGKSARTT